MNIKSFCFRVLIGFLALNLTLGYIALFYSWDEVEWKTTNGKKEAVTIKKTPCELRFYYVPIVGAFCWLQEERK